MKTTASLMDIIQSELINNGLNEFVNKVDGTPQIISNNDKFTYIRKVAQYDEDVQAVVDRTFFMNFKFKNDTTDSFFKRSFITRFLDRQIGNQTVDLFANHLVSFSILNEAYIDNLVTNFEKYLNGDSNTETKNTTNEKDGHNDANITLPQDNVSLDLTKDTADYADTNDIYRAFADTVATGNNHSNGYNADVLDKMAEQWDNLMYRFDKKLFLQIW